MKLVYVGDGPRDEAMLPRFVEPITGPHQPDFVAWKDVRLNRGRGYGRKLTYVATVRAVGSDGLVAVVDTDGDRARRGELVDARDRLGPNRLPLAVGAAHPHGEAWLVDDVEPLRRVLGLAPTAPAPRGDHPKAELQVLLDADPREDRELLALLAAEVDPARCRRARETGLASFLTDVAAEFRSS